MLLYNVVKYNIIMLIKPNLTYINKKKIIVVNIIELPLYLKNIRFKCYNFAFYSIFILILTCIKNKKILYKRKDIFLIIKFNDKTKLSYEIIININTIYQYIYLILIMYFNRINFISILGQKDLSRSINLDYIITIQETNIDPSEKYNREKKVKINLYLKIGMTKRLSRKICETISRL